MKVLVHVVSLRFRCSRLRVHTRGARKGGGGGMNEKGGGGKREREIMVNTESQAEQ